MFRHAVIQSYSLLVMQSYSRHVILREKRTILSRLEIIRVHAPPRRPCCHFLCHLVDLDNVSSRGGNHLSRKVGDQATSLSLLLSDHHQYLAHPTDSTTTIRNGMIEDFSSHTAAMIGRLSGCLQEKYITLITTIKRST